MIAVPLYFQTCQADCVVTVLRNRGVAQNLAASHDICDIMGHRHTWALASMSGIRFQPSSGEDQYVHPGNILRLNFAQKRGGWNDRHTEQYSLLRRGPQDERL